MARPNLSDARRRELIGTVATTFAELGYRRTTTANLAERCGVQEVVLYRLWTDKRAMFVAAIEFVGSNAATRRESGRTCFRPAMARARARTGARARTNSPR